MILLYYNILYAGKLLMKKRTIIYMCTYLLTQMIVVALSVLNGDVFTAVYVLYLVWLMTIAYVDYATGYVYVAMEYAVIAPVVGSLVLVAKDFLLYNKTSVNLLICCSFGSILIMILFVCLLGRCGCFGDGDVDVLAVSLLILVCRHLHFNQEIFYSNYAHVITECFICQIQYVYITVLLFILRYQKSINWKKFQLDGSRPFVPSIYMTSIMLLFT